MDIALKSGSRIASIYGTTSTQENYYCNFGVNPDYIDRLKSANLKVVGSDAEGEVRIIEIAEHPFYIGTLFVPQTNSRLESPHPIITGFLSAAVKFQLKTVKVDKLLSIVKR